MSSPSPLWYLDRSAGEVTLILLTAVLVLGIVRAALPAAFPFLVEGAHRNLALMAIVFAGIHVLAAVLDPFARLGAIDVFVPFASAYRGTWLGLGVVSGYLYASAVLTSWPARRLPREAWVWLHRVMYVGWLLAILHSLGTGSDARNQTFLFLNVIAVGTAVVIFVSVRVVKGWATHPRRWAAVAVMALSITVALGVWAATGPLQPGWARSSGTPVNLLQSR